MSGEISGNERRKRWPPAIEEPLMKTGLDYLRPVFFLHGDNLPAGVGRNNGAAFKAFSTSGQITY